MYQQQLLERPNVWNVYVKAPQEESSAEWSLSMWQKCSWMAGDTWSPDYLKMTPDSGYLGEMESNSNDSDHQTTATSRQAVF